jgi:large subunit ribosomal protein L19
MNISPVNMEARKNLDMRTGDNVRVYQKIQDKGGKTRLQAFEGMVIARKHGTEAGGTFTVRRNTNGFGVEKIFPLYSPMIDRIEITKRSKVRRSKLYHVRETALKQISKRLKMMFVDIKEDTKEPEPVEEVKTEEVVKDETEATENPKTEDTKEESKTE